MLTAMSNKITKNILAMFKSIGANENQSEDEASSSSSDGESDDVEEKAEDIKAREEKQ